MHSKIMLDKSYFVRETYFSFNVFSWLVGGGVVQLFHIAVVIGFSIAFGIAQIMIPRQRKVAL